jgi:beta-galactosidase
MPVFEPAVTGQVTWTIRPGGEIEVKAEIRRNPVLPALPRFGLRLFLPESLRQVEYFGFGPYESYIDKRRASFRHLYRADLAAMHENYLKPQENGSHYGCTHLEIRDALGGLRVRGESFCFNASEYTQEELTRKAHSFELEKCGAAVLCVDAFQTGIGSASCGPSLAEAYASPAEAVMRVVLSPFCS